MWWALIELSLNQEKLSAREGLILLAENESMLSLRLMPNSIKLAQTYSG
jgi:hypothetical protein